MQHLPKRVYALTSRSASDVYVYVGSTILAAEDRLLNHVKDAWVSKKGMRALHRWLRQQGESKIELVWLDEYESETEAIEALRSKGHILFNQRSGGCGRRQEYHLSDEQIERLPTTSNRQIAREVGCSAETIRRYRRRFEELGVI